MTTTTAPHHIRIQNRNTDNLPVGVELWRTNGCGYWLRHAASGLPMNSGPHTYWRTQRDLIAAATQLPNVDWTVDKAAVYATLGADGVQLVRRVLTPTRAQMPAGDAALAPANHDETAGVPTVEDAEKVIAEAQDMPASARATMLRMLAQGNEQAGSGDVARLYRDAANTAQREADHQTAESFVGMVAELTEAEADQSLSVTADELDRHVRATGPVEIRTPEGWRPYVTTFRRMYSCVVTVLNGGDEVALDTRHETVLTVRPAQAAPPTAPRYVPPAGGQSRVVHGSWLRRYVGWQWLTPHGEWECITAAYKNKWGQWFITTPSTVVDRDWREPESAATIRPACWPVETVKQREISDECECQWWAASVWTPAVEHADRDFARYPVANCPAHPAHPAGRAVTVVGGVRVDRRDAQCLEMDGIAAPERVTVGRVVRTWIHPREGRRWYEISMVLTGELVSRPDTDIAGTHDPGWDYPTTDGSEFPVIFEVDALQDDGRWGHVLAEFASAHSYEPAELAGLAGRLAAVHATDTRRRVRVSVIPAREEHRYLHPDHIGYATEEPSFIRSVVLV